MRKGLILSSFPSILLCLWASALTAQGPKSQKTISVPTEPDPAGGTMAVLCCTPSDLFTSRNTCSHVWKRKAGAGSLNVHVKLLCDDLKENATAVALNGEWHVFPKAEPRQALFLINCHSGLAWTLEASPSLDPPPLSQTSTTDPTPASSAADPQASGSSDKGRQGTEKVNNRLTELEKALSEQKKTVQSLKEELDKRSAAYRELEKKLDDLQTEIQKKLRALGEAQKDSCYRIDDNYKGHEEVTIAVAGSVLRFLAVKPRESSVPIGLAEAKASELLAEVQGQSSTTIFPHIYLAVPEAVREVQPFFLQDRLIDPNLYSRLTGGKDAGRVSYQDVSRFIEELNSRCSGRATFALPTEEQFVAAAHWLYKPVSNGLKTCDNLRKEDLRSDITELLGNSWQLTRSLCQTFSEHPKATCPDNSYVRKGGAASSNRLECMPEYRSPAPFDVNQKETSFRLALVK